MEFSPLHATIPAHLHAKGNSMSTSTRIGNAHLTVDVAPLGAEMQALTSSDGRQWLWNGDATFWAGRSPILFPIVGKAPGDMIAVEGKHYPMAQHGFARRRAFDLTAANETMCRFELATSAETREVYPFNFRLAVQHEVLDRAVTVSAEVFNNDTVAMPFGLGFHSAFAWPLPGAEGRAHDVVLDNGAEPDLVRLEGGLVKPGTLPSPFAAGRLTLDPAMFVDDAMIFPEGTGTGLRYGVDGGPALKFGFANLPNLALWSKPGAPFLCVEPWHGTAARLDGSSALGERPYTVVLQPGASARFAFTVEIVL